jgi:hypothetical protein
MYGLYSRAASNQERPMMARVAYGILFVGKIQFGMMLFFVLHLDWPDPFWISGPYGSNLVKSFFTYLV